MSQPTIITEKCDLSEVEDTLVKFYRQQMDLQSKVYFTNDILNYDVNIFLNKLDNIDNSLTTLWSYTDLKNKGIITGVYNPRGFILIGSSKGTSMFETCSIFIHELGHKKCYSTGNDGEPCAEKYRTDNIYRCEGI